MSSTPQPSSDPAAHSDPIPISTNGPHRVRPRSASESSVDSVPPLSPASQSPASAQSLNIQTPFSSTTRIPVTPMSPSSPILSYFYGSPTKTPFNRATYNTTFEDEESSAPAPPPPTPATAHGRRMSNSWIPVRFGPQQQQQQQTSPTAEGQQDRGAGLLRRLSLGSALTNKPPGRTISPPNQDGGTRPGNQPSPRSPGPHRKAATLSAGTVDASKKPRAPSPMGERMLKGHYEGF